MDDVTIHISDWNLQDRLILLPYEEAKAILLDRTKLASDRMSELYKLAVDKGTADGNPHVRDLDEADVFLGWPAAPGFENNPGFTNNDEWDAEFAEDLAFFED